MGISIWQLTIIAIIVALLFGTKRLRSLGGDLGTTIKGFKNAMSHDLPNDELQQELSNTANQKEKS